MTPAEPLNDAMRAQHQKRLERFEQELATLHAQRKMIDRLAPGIAVFGLVGFFIHWLVPVAAILFAGILWSVTRYIRYTHVMETEERISDTRRILGMPKV